MKGHERRVDVFKVVCCGRASRSTCFSKQLLFFIFNGLYLFNLNEILNNCISNSDSNHLNCGLISCLPGK